MNSGTVIDIQVVRVRMRMRMKQEGRLAGEGGTNHYARIHAITALPHCRLTVQAPRMLSKDR